MSPVHLEPAGKLPPTCSEIAKSWRKIMKRGQLADTGFDLNTASPCSPKGETTVPEPDYRWQPEKLKARTES